MIDYRENAKWIVYIHISPSNKYYVGVTSQFPERRWHNGRGYTSNPHFTRAIEKYGWDNFQHEIICSCVTEDEAYLLEISLIKALKSNDYNYGYNIADGGKGSPMSGEKNAHYGKKLSDEHKQKLSEAHKGKKLSDEHKKKISKHSKKMWRSEEFRNKMTGVNHCCYGRTGEFHPMYGKHGSEITNSKKVICLNTLEIFESAVDGSKAKNCNSSKLSMCCRGERLSCGEENGIRLVWMYYNDYLLLNEYEINKKIELANAPDKITKHSNKAVVNLDDKICFKSIKTAGKYYDSKSFARIGMSCKNSNIKACGKHWMFYDDYLKENNLTDEEAQTSLFFVA